MKEHNFEHRVFFAEDGVILSVGKEPLLESDQIFTFDLECKKSEKSWKEYFTRLVETVTNEMKGREFKVTLTIEGEFIEE